MFVSWKYWGFLYLILSSVHSKYWGIDLSELWKLSPINPGNKQPHTTPLNKLSTLHTIVNTLVTIDSSKGIGSIVIVCIGKQHFHPHNCNQQLSLCLLKSSCLTSDILRMVNSQLWPGTCLVEVNVKELGTPNFLKGKVWSGDTCPAGYCGCD